MSWDAFLVGTKNGLAMGSAFALMALGYSMVYGIVKMINFAHSEFITIGAFIAFYTSNLLHKLGWPFKIPMLLVSLAVAILVCVIVALFTERFAYRPLRNKGSTRITALITAIGISYMINGLMNYIEANQQSFPLFFEDNNITFAISLSATALLLILLTVFVNKTKMGIAMRAVSENEKASKLMGINNNFVIAMTFVIGSALAAIGVVIYLLRSRFFNFELGSVYIGLYPFVAAVIGGIGSLPGAVVGGFMIGMLQEYCAAFQISSWTPVIIYGTFVIILLLKPSGLFGKETGEKV